jgi:hypothetical protein
MGIWEYGNMGIWEFGNLGIWEFGKDSQSSFVTFVVKVVRKPF